jgi:putative ABC transport system permease protein
VIEQQNLTTGSVNPVELHAENPAGPFGPATLALVAGRYPTGAGHVALTPKVASLYDTGIGRSRHAAGRVWHVVGLVQNPADLLDEFALAASGQLYAPDSVTILLDATPTFRLPSQPTLQTPPPAPGGFSPAVIVLVLAIFKLLFVGMIAAAAFTVLAQRRLRALGMVSALGATDRNVRLVMIANGAVVGALAALARAATGVLLRVAYAPHLQASAGCSAHWLARPSPTLPPSPTSGPAKRAPHPHPRRPPRDRRRRRLAPVRPPAHCPVPSAPRLTRPRYRAGRHIRGS